MRFVLWACGLKIIYCLLSQVDGYHDLNDDDGIVIVKKYYNIVILKKLSLIVGASLFLLEITLG